jgi:hypothetical protein
MVGVDSNEDNLLNPEAGAYARLAAMRAREPRRLAGRTVVFLQWDCTKPLESGYDAPVVHDKALLAVGRTALAHFEKTRVPRGLGHLFSVAGPGRFDAATAMFCLHYFFGAPASAAAVLDAVATRLGRGGVFVACFMDGQRVDELLRRSGKGRVARGEAPGGRLMWELTARYDALDDEPTKNFGKTVDVFVESINRVVPENLVDPRLLARLMADRGMAPHALIGGASTGTFDELHATLLSAGAAAPAAAVDAAKLMTDQHKAFSFLNRWVAFSKK